MLLAGPKDGVNLTYMTTDKFIESSIKVFRNGVRQRRDAPCDYIATESGGPGAGFDTVIFADYPPILNENLFADYLIST